MKSLERLHLLTAIEQSPHHVLLVAPSGYGKSMLLRSLLNRTAAPLIEARADTTLAEILNTASNSGHLMCMVDAAHLLQPEIVTGLISHPTTDVRFVLALYHQHYARAVRLSHQLMSLTAQHLAFTGAEVLSLHSGVNVTDTMERTLGWPAMIGTEINPMADLTTYLDELVNDLPSTERHALLDAAADDSLDTYLLLARKEGQLAALLNSGFPIIPAEGRLQVHPAMLRHLQDMAGLGHQVMRAPDEVLQNLLEQMPVTPERSRVALMQYYFERYGEDMRVRDTTALKIKLLKSVPLLTLPPSLRDLLAAYLILEGDTEQSHSVLLTQLKLKVDTTYTHTLLATIANLRIDLVAYQEHINAARALAKDDVDWSRVYRTETNLLMRLARQTEALETSAKHYKHAVRSGRTELIISSLAQISWVRYFSGNLAGAREAATEALGIAEREGGRYVTEMTYLLYQLSEMTKDAGEHDLAMQLVQRGLALRSVDSTLPYLYHTRGLIYQEYGSWNEALLSLRAALEEFQVRGNVIGIVMTHAYMSFSQYMLGNRAEVTQHLHALRQTVQRVGTSHPDYTEHLAFEPLVDGLALLMGNKPAQALAAFERISLEGKLSYDSVLLTRLMVARVRVDLGRFRKEDAAMVVSILDARNSPGDPTARMYASHFFQVFEACAQLGVQPERFRALTGAASPSAVELYRPAYTLSLTTLGRLGFSVNGDPIRTRDRLPLYTLAYLALTTGDKTVDGIAADLFTEKPDAKNAANKGVSKLRGVLRDLDRELEKDLLSPARTGSVRLLSPPTHVQVTLDVTAYLSDIYTPINPDTAQLERLLEEASPFLPTLEGSAFASRINTQLEDRTVAVARHLCAVHSGRGDLTAAVRVLLQALRLVPDPELTDLLVQKSKDAPSIIQEKVGAVLRHIAVEDDAGDTGHLITHALGALARR